MEEKKYVAWIQTTYRPVGSGLGSPNLRLTQQLEDHDDEIFEFSAKDDDDVHERADERVRLLQTSRRGTVRVVKIWHVFREVSARNAEKKSEKGE
jgi:hypothetical protein